MLLLRRKLSEKIYIGRDIVLTVCDIDRQGVRIGIEAPKELLILRAELERPAEVESVRCQ